MQVRNLIRFRPRVRVRLKVQVRVRVRVVVVPGLVIALGWGGGLLAVMCLSLPSLPSLSAQRNQAATGSYP